MKRLLCTSVVLGALTAAAQGQTSPALIVLPWQDDSHVEMTADAMIFNGGHTDSPTSDGVHLQIVRARGRAALDPAEPNLRFGGELLYINIDSNDPALPERLVDQSFAVGFGIARVDNWEIGATVGFGYAGNNPYADSEALYGLASLIFAYRIDEDQSVQFLLDYDGNRSVLPDVPLPGFVYQRRINDVLSVWVGFPYSAITWKPIDRLTLDVRYAVPYSFQARAGYELTDGLSIFGLFANSTDAFRLDDDPRDHRRLFFSQRRAERGIDWQPSPRCRILLAGGYAFDQKFEYGFDTRDLDTVRDLSDEPYLRAEAGFRF